MLVVARPTAIASLARTALDAAARAGVDEQVLLARAELDPAVVQAADGRILVSDLLRLWETAAELSGNPFFGLFAGEHVVSARTIHVVGFAARNSATLAECYGHTVRFANITNEASDITLTHERGRGIIAVSPKPGLPTYPRVYAEMAMSAYLSIGRKWVGVAFRPLLTTFQHPAPPDLDEYHRLFGTNLRFGAAKNQLVLAAATLELPMNTSDPEMLAYFQEQAASLGDATLDTPLEQRVRAEIARLLGSQQPTLALVAPRLAMSPRTLQRKLAAADLLFNSLVDDVRRIEALRMIGARDPDIPSIATRVGYRDLDAFRAAFQRWTGKTPRDYRRES